MGVAPSGLTRKAICGPQASDGCNICALSQPLCGLQLTGVVNLIIYPCSRPFPSVRPNNCLTCSSCKCHCILIPGVYLVLREYSAIRPVEQTLTAPIARALVASQRRRTIKSESDQTRITVCSVERLMRVVFKEYQRRLSF
jgi:hypothetical protein